MTELQIDLIKPNQDQPRKQFDPEALQELADSIATVGLLNPILVRPNGAGFEIVHGERRWRACQLAGLETIRAEVRELDDETAFLIAFTENLQRDDLSPIEEAEALKTLRDRFGYSQAEIGAKIGKSQQYIAGRLALLRLAEPVQEMITTRVVNPSMGVRLAAVDDGKFQTVMAKQAAQENLTVKDLEKHIKEWNWKNDRFFKSEKLKLFFDTYPELAPLLGAIEKEQIVFFIASDCYLQIQTAEKEFSGQWWHWPKYSGQELIIGPGPWREDIAGLDEFNELPDTPLFTEQEWQEINGYGQFGNDIYSQIKQVLGDPLSGLRAWPDILRAPQEPEHLRENEYKRRIYDPDYGRFLVEPKDKDTAAFVKKGWGVWAVIEFNDGEGQRTRRRYFEHDYITKTLVEQLAETVDPFSFTHENFQRMKLWRLMPAEMSWWYIRRRTISKDDAIAALEEDLERLRNASPLSDDEFNERLLDELQSFVVSGMGSMDWREGVQTYPRLPDSSVDAEKARAVYSGF